MNADVNANTELYALIERLLHLRDAEHAFRWRMEQVRREAMATENRYREEEHKLRVEYDATLKAIRERLSVPEPVPSDPGSIPDLEALFGQFFGTKANESPFG